MSSLVGSDSGARGAHVKGQTSGQHKKGDNLFGPCAVAAVAAGGSCVLLSGCFSFLGNFSSFLLIFSVTRAIAE